MKILIRRMRINVDLCNSIFADYFIFWFSIFVFFKISICDDIAELKEAYFRSFKAEGIAQPHKLYTGSWRTPTMAKYLGISIDVLDGDSSFVLIKLTKNSGTVDIDGRNLRLSSGAAQER